MLFLASADAINILAALIKRGAPATDHAIGMLLYLSG